MACDSANEWTQRMTNSIPNHSTMTPSSAACSSSPPAAESAQPPPQKLRCPRCDSANTKFCYYNNYSLSQPRHFCKACKRYWTRGGTLRNVPVGGGCRKNKRVKKAATPASVTNVSASLPTPTFFGQTSAATVPFPALPTIYNLQPQLNSFGVTNEILQLGFGTGLSDLQFLNSYHLPSFNQELHEQVKVEAESNATGILDWQAQAPYETTNQFDAACLYWNSPMVGGGGWPDVPLM